MDVIVIIIIDIVCNVVIKANNSTYCIFY